MDYPHIGWSEVPVTPLGCVLVRVVGDPRVFEWQHERDPLSHATRPFFLRQVHKRLTGDRFLGDVISLLPDPFELEGRPVKAWIGTDSPIPFGIVPRNANRYVLFRILHDPPESFRPLDNDLQIVMVRLDEANTRFLISERNWDIAIHLTEQFVSYVSHRIVIAHYKLLAA
jgi:hypothetical protein